MIYIDNGARKQSQMKGKEKKKIDNQEDKQTEEKQTNNELPDIRVSQFDDPEEFIEEIGEIMYKLFLLQLKSYK